jgi:hypothetical protein
MMHRPSGHDSTDARTLSDMQEPIPVVLCFDVEPDDIDVRPGAKPWLGFERLLERVRPWRDGLAEATGRPVHFNWFLRIDPQVADIYGSATWAVERYRTEIERLRSDGDGIGLHPHALRWSEANGRSVADHEDADWVDYCIRVSYESYQAALGEPCRVQRFGDRLMTARAARLSAQLGAHYDLTVEPGAPPVRSLHPGTASTGNTADMRSAPREPYRPSQDDAMRAGDGRLWMIPLTSMDPDPMLSTWRRVARRVRHPGGPSHRPTTLTAVWPAAPFWTMIEQEVATMTRPYLAFAIRSDAPLIPQLIGPIEDKISALLRSPLAAQLVFAGPDAVIERPVEMTDPGRLPNSP